MDPLNAPSVVPAPRTELDPAVPSKHSLLNEETFKTKFATLLSNFNSTVVTTLEENRDARDMVVNVPELQAAGQL